MQNYHVPVLLDACIKGLQIKKDGTYVDVTFGGGGHSKAILEHLDEGKLFSFDQDPDAKQNAKEIKHPGFQFIPANFRHMRKYLRLYGVKQVDGILADLGVSSHQIDTAERGFATRLAGDLDMRMSQSGASSASELVNTLPEAELHKIFGMYGELKNAKTAAAEIVRVRKDKPIKTTTELTAILATIAPKGKEFKYYAQVFQALRIVVNDEMAVLEEFLEQVPETLASGGRLVVMSYHSLEDRMVKNFIRSGSISGEQEKDFYGNLLRPLEPLTRKPMEATAKEIEINPRSRSARLRIAEKP